MTTKTKPGAAKRALFIARKTRAKDGAFEMTIAANDVSRNPFDEIRLDGGVFDNYLRNPVVLWSHDDHALPVARTTALRFEDGELRATFEFMPDDPMAERVKRAWELGFVNAASIRFNPLEVDTSDSSKPFGVVTEWELLEWSLVPIPADPDAVRAVLRSLRQEDEEEEPGEEPEEEPEDEGEKPTLEELAEQVEELQTRVTDLTERVEALEDDEPEEEPEEDSEEPGDESDEPMDERLVAQLDDVLAAIGERK